MNNTAAKVIIGLLLISLTVAVASQLEKVERIINEGPNLNVRKNNFYAAGKFLESQGIEVKHSTEPVSLMELSQNESLLLTNSYIFEDDDDISNLIEWISDGGNLIFQHNDGDNFNPIAAYFDIFINDDTSAQEYKDLRQSYYDQLEEKRTQLEQDKLSPKQLVRADIDLIETSLPEPLISHYQASGSEQKISLYVQSPISIEHSLIQQGYSEEYREQMSLVTVGGNRYSDTIATFSYGRGNITVITDASIWNNHQIGRFDHAHLLATLTQHSDKVSIQRFVNWPSLDKLIIRYAPELTLSLILALFAWLLSKSQRFGPVSNNSHTDRRALQEHIQAVGNFHYQHGHHNHLLSALRKEIRIQMQHRDSTFMQLPDAKQFALISDISGIAENQIIFAMREADQYKDNQLFELIQLLTKIRNAL
ncbi:DUF4350 domain-containing protein [Neptuniibacter caesariensis]|uniref:DUF4350 domain-containing protein n=1 Tax=Neptuniibacter caesariensis TaxID=207954 RepID=A0A7U8C5T1_NEPCE|nr:DUF4350 domain-containing protein [Neptuniibacter caesariensis]EAR61231.1 hypothetical protein MED92_10909 [Oceanospirillum sp. MED92] [Neptuniibacter caesariensis]